MSESSVSSRITVPVIRIFALLIVIASYTWLLPDAAIADVVREDNPVVGGAPRIHLYRWRDDQQPRRAVAIAVHGLIMHGGTYDALARSLARNGIVVLAPDLRGYGRWCDSRALGNPREDEQITLQGMVPTSKTDIGEWRSTEHKIASPPHKSPKIVYSQSYKDLMALTEAVRDQYPSTPVYLIGESLGAGLAMHLASDRPDLIDGLVLSSPAIKKKINIVPRMIYDLMVFMAKPKKEVNLVPYIQKFASEDPETARAAVEDPLVRKKISAWDLLKTARLVSKNVKYAENIPESVPVLIIQGDKDRMVKSNGVVLLLSHLKSRDQTVKWFPGKGHLLLETPRITRETVVTVRSWLMDHMRAARPLKSARARTNLSQGWTGTFTN